jgi:asparagine synthase (glutamine-hydrolysing)
MCGVAGIFGNHGAPANTTRAALERMTEVMHDRGPDDSGVYVSDSGTVVLGHTRLSIIDPSLAGHQPMCNETGDIWTTYNGEIYNFPDLRLELRNRGHTFKSKTDTEVLIHGYEQWGIEGLVTRLRGMFSFGLYDFRGAPHRPERLMLARDRLGQKPLYYVYSDGVFIFASQIAAILASGMVRPRIDPTAIGSYLSFGHIPPPQTAYRGISALRPGHYLIVDQNGLAERRYYDLTEAYNKDALEDINESDAVESVKSCLLDTLKRHLLSDVPVGVFLSGGIDSSSIVAGMRRIGHDSIRTVSVAFPDSDCDESVYARQVARTYDTDHVEVNVSSADLGQHIERIFRVMDQPTVDGVNTYFVAHAAARTGLKVALSGVGGDEIFWGYPSFRHVPRLHRLHRAVSYLPIGGPVVGRLLGSRGWSRTARLASMMSGDGSVSGIYKSYRQVFTMDQIGGLLDRDLAAQVTAGTDAKENNHESLRALTIPAQVGYLETTRYMANQLLRDTDSFSMAHSLEVRSPFVDHVLVELLARIPDRFKTGRKGPKHLLVAALDGGLPHAIVRRRKQGFVFPFGKWLTNGLRAFTETTLDTAPHFNRPFVRALLQGFLADKVHWSRIWSLIVLSHWLEQTL